MIAKVKSGDGAAFAELLEPYQKKLRNIVQRYFSNEDDINDLMQNVRLKLFRGLKKFRGESRFYTWAYRIAVNTSKNELQTRSRHPEHHNDADDLTAEEYANYGYQSTDDPFELVAAEELKEIINEAFSGLPEDQRNALSLREFNGTSYESIGDIEGIPIGTARSRIFRAREAVNEAVDKALFRYDS